MRIFGQYMYLNLIIFIRIVLVYEINYLYSKLNILALHLVNTHRKNSTMRKNKMLKYNMKIVDGLKRHGKHQTKLRSQELKRPRGIMYKMINIHSTFKSKLRNI